MQSESLACAMARLSNKWNREKILDLVSKEEYDFGMKSCIWPAALLVLVTSPLMAQSEDAATGEAAATIAVSESIEAGVARSKTLLTGEIEDAAAQQILMPRFVISNANTRTVEWLAPEGSAVDVGDLVVRLDPSDLIAQKESLEIQLEDTLANAEAQTAQQDLGIFDAETALIRAESTLELAKLDASTPKGTIPDLTYERNQLSLANATNALKRAIRAYEDAKLAKEQAIPLRERTVDRAQKDMDDVDEAVGQTEIHATQPGFVIYGTNSWTDEKVYPGAAVMSSMEIAKVASQDSLQFRFWAHEADVRTLRVGSKVAVTPDALPEFSVIAEITWISSQANTRDWSDGGYFQVIAIPTKDERIPAEFLPGMAVVGEVVN